jgi:EamA domain-containing membrane protein RarD
MKSISPLMRALTAVCASAIQIHSTRSTLACWPPASPEVGSARGLYFGVPQVDPTTTVPYLTLNPISAMVLGIVVLGEKLTAELIVGMALVLIGILVGCGAFFAEKRLT